MVKKNAAISFIFITVLIDVIGMGIIIPVIPALIQKLTGEGLSRASLYGGWLLFAYAVTQFIFSPVLGGLSDRFGRRPVLLLSLCGLGIDYIFMAFAPSIFWLFVGRVIAGVGGASFTTATAYIADITAPEKRAQNFGLIGVAFGVGFIIGPAIGSFSSKWGTEVPFLVSAVITLLNFLYGLLILPESLKPENRRAFDWKRANPKGSLMQLRKYPLISGLVVSLTLIYIASHAVQSNWTYYTMLKFGWTTEKVGYSLAFVGVLAAIVQGGLIRVIIPKIGQKRSVYLGLMLYTVGMLLFGFASSGWMMFAILVPYCLGGIAGPALQGIMSNQVPANEQGELQGGLTSLMSLTYVVGPLIMNSIFAYFTLPSAPVYFPGAPFMLATLLGIVSTLYAVKYLESRYDPQPSVVPGR
jgi:DHA1 family tetracycline resistance protein-like MFS transporter